MYFIQFINDKIIVYGKKNNLMLYSLLYMFYNILLNRKNYLQIIYIKRIINLNFYAIKNMYLSIS
jgi:hypothetical protein